MLTFEAGLSEQRESFLEWNLEDFNVHNITVAFRKQPEIVGKYNTWHQVNQVVALQSYHQSELEDHSEETKEGKLVPTMGSELTEAKHATTNVAREEEIIGFSIGHSDGVETREIPQISIRETNKEELL